LEMFVKNVRGTCVQCFFWKLRRAVSERLRDVFSDIVCPSCSTWRTIEPDCTGYISVDVRPTGEVLVSAGSCRWYFSQVIFDNNR